MSPQISRKAAASATLVLAAGILGLEEPNLSQASFSPSAARDPNPQVLRVSGRAVENARVFINAGLDQFATKPEELKAYAGSFGSGQTATGQSQILDQAIKSGLISQKMRENIESYPDPQQKAGAMAVLYKLEQSPELIKIIRSDRDRIVDAIHDNSLITSAEARELKRLPLAAIYNLADVAAESGDLSKVQRREMHTTLEVYRVWAENFIGFYFSPDSGHSNQIAEYAQSPLMTRLLGAVALNNRMVEVNYRGSDHKTAGDALSATLGEVLKGK